MKFITRFCFTTVVRCCGAPHDLCVMDVFPKSVLRDCLAVCMWLREARCRQIGWNSGKIKVLGFISSPFRFIQFGGQRWIWYLQKNKAQTTGYLSPPVFTTRVWYGPHPSHCPVNSHSCQPFLHCQLNGVTVLKFRTWIAMTVFHWTKVLRQRSPQKFEF